MKPFPHRPWNFSTVAEYVEERARLLALRDSQELCESDDLGNTDTIGNVATADLRLLSEQCARAAWHPAARAALTEAGLL